MGTSLAEAVEPLIASKRAGVRVARDATVIRYDAATQTADVQPCVQDVAPDGAGVPSPVIYGVPVAWPSGGGRSLAWGIDVGDLGTLIIRDVSHDEVDAGADVPTTPAASRRWDLSDAVFLPRDATPAAPLEQVRDDGAPVLAMPDDEGLHLGTAAANQALAIAQNVADRLARLETLFTLHVHPVAGASATVQVPPPYTDPSAPTPPGPTTKTADVATGRAFVDG